MIMASVTTAFNRTVRSNPTNATGPGGAIAGGDFTTVAPCTSKDCEDDDKGIPQEAVIFLVTVLVFVLLLVIFFLYLNKSLCFSECGGFPCIDKVPQKNHTLDSDTEDDLQEVQHTTAAGITRESSAPHEGNPASRKSRSRSRVTAPDGGEVQDGNGSAVQDGGKSSLAVGKASTSQYTRLK